MEVYFFRVTSTTSGVTQKPTAGKTTVPPPVDPSTAMPLPVNTSLPPPEMPAAAAAIQLPPGPPAIPKPILDMKPVPVEPIIVVQNGIPVPVKIPKPVRAYTSR